MSLKDKLDQKSISVLGYEIFDLFLSGKEPERFNGYYAYKNGEAYFRNTMDEARKISSMIEKVKNPDYDKFHTLRQNINEKPRELFKEYLREENPSFSDSVFELTYAYVMRNGFKSFDCLEDAVVEFDDFAYGFVDKVVKSTLKDREGE